MEKLLELENVSYSYQDGKEKNQILDHASYLFEKGKIYAVVGASGSGKTTTLSLASGLDKPDDGKVLFKGKDIQEIGLNKYRREDISIVFQSYNLIYYMNALENVMSALEIAGIKRKDKEEYCLSILEQLGLSKDECKRDIRQLSGGQQQRVAIARAIAREVDLILCDEPTGNLDEKNSIEIMNTFLDLAHIHHKCVILVTHSPTLAKMCDVSLRIKEGKIEAKRQSFAFKWLQNLINKKIRMGLGFCPNGLRWVLNEIYGRYHIPLFIAENGLGAIDNGVDLFGYTWWGPIDLVSSSTGEMKKRYGFIYVDLDNTGNGTLERKRKDSFYYYKKLIESNGVCVFDE